MKYIPTIGLEVHVQLNTRTKIFCSCQTSFGDAANSHTCPVCLALPGALPVLNQEVLRKAVMAGLSVNAQIHERNVFARKNYFYPDLPKAYQISQFDEPFCTNGEIFIDDENGNKKRIGITRIHMEEDAGKLIHSENSNIQESYVDLNRSGTPLIEIVSEPEIDSSQEAVQYLTRLKSIMEYIDVSDCNMEQGSLRVDANISLRLQGSEKLGTRAEIKNLNSFRAVKAAIEYEMERQAELLDDGKAVVQETRLWNALNNETVSMRGKEDAHDYRYFPDPDLVPVKIEREQVEAWRNELPELAAAKKERFIEEYGLPEYDADILTLDKQVSRYFEEAVTAKAPPKKVSNWIMAEMMAVTSEKNCRLNDLFSPAFLSELILQIENGAISGKMAKKVFQEMLVSRKSPLQIIEEKGLKQISDTSSLEKIIEEVMSENPETLASIRAGKDRAFGFLVGQVMKKSKGQANPKMVNEMLQKKLQEGSN